MNSVALAFLRRDFLLWSSYRLAFISQFMGVFVVIGIAYFMGRTVGNGGEQLEKYGGDYAAFLLSGFALTDLFGRGMGSLPRVIRENQQNGTLEPMLATPLRLLEFVIGSSLFSLSTSVVRTTVTLLFGAFVLGFWTNVNPVSLLIVFIPGAVALFALGLLFTALVVLIKQADPVIGAYGAMAAILGGMVFPVEALPIWLRPLSWLVPLSHALSGMRLAMLGEGPSVVAPQALALVGLAAVMLPVAVVAFSWSITRAKQDGSLAQY